MGSKRFAEADIIRASGLKLGRDTSLADLQRASSKLAGSGVFTAVNYRYTTSGPEMTVEFDVEDEPQFLPCVFTNFIWFTEDELLSDLHSRLPLFSGEVPVAGDLSDQVSAALVALLREKGIEGRVIYTTKAHLGGPVEGMAFMVEGVKIHLRAVHFTGNKNLKGAALEDVMRPEIGQEYDREILLDYARFNVGALYLSRGYLRVSFGNPILQIASNGPRQYSLVATFPVSEGLPYRLAGIHWSGETIFSAADLGRHVHLAVGQPVNDIQLKKDLGEISRLYGTRGFLEASVQAKPELNDAAQSATYELAVREGSLYRMGKLEISGLDAGRVQKLEKAWEIKPGEPFDDGYMRKFLRQIGRYLPSPAGGWELRTNMNLERSSKVVNLAIAVVPRGNP